LSKPFPYIERDLFERIAAGDEKAFRQLYDEHWSNVYGMALTYTRSAADAQDIVQEVFLSIWEKNTKLSQVESPASYLYIFTRNLIISSLRKKAVKALSLDEPGESGQLLPDNFLLPDSGLIVKQSEVAIEKAIEQLTPQQKQIFILSRKEGLSHEEIAIQLGINRYTVKNHIVAALNSLRRQLSREELLLLLPLFILAGKKL
jgi:RNA polymerase sigma-70 factor (family 1)